MTHRLFPLPWCSFLRGICLLASLETRFAVACVVTDLVFAKRLFAQLTELICNSTFEA